MMGKVARPVPACPLGPGIHRSPQAHPGLCQPQRVILTLCWPSLGSACPATSSLPSALRCHRAREGMGWGQGRRIHLGPSQVSRAGPHPPARRPRRRSPRSGRFYGRGKDFSHPRAGRWRWQGRRAAGHHWLGVVKPGERGPGTDQPLTPLIGTAPARGETLEPAGYRVIPSPPGPSPRCCRHGRAGRRATAATSATGDSGKEPTALPARASAGDEVGSEGRRGIKH